MTGEAWLAGRVPDAYARQTLRTAHETIEREAEALDETTAALAAGERQQLLARVGDLETLLDGLQAGVEERDRAAVSAEVERLKSLEEALQPPQAKGERR